VCSRPAEWYQGDWTLRGGAFDLSQTPTGGISPEGANLDPTFEQFALIGEIERRYQVWGQPGAIKITGFVNRGRAAPFADAIALAEESGPYLGDANAALTAARTYDSRPGVSVNLQQQISDDVGVFARAGWSDGNIEPWDFTDIDRTVSGGVSINGKPRAAAAALLRVQGHASEANHCSAWITCPLAYPRRDRC
jgi:high affinity Mn2+ porin